MTGPSDQSRPIFRYTVNIGAGEQEVASLVPPDLVFEHGLCTEAILGVIGSDPGNSEGVAPDRFQENPAFVQFLQEVISDHVYGLDDLVREGKRHRNGHIYLIDGRTPQPDGSVPPEDIIGAVDVEDGSLVPGSYEHNPNHRLLTEDGFFLLPPQLEAVLDREVRARCTRPR